MTDLILDIAEQRAAGIRSAAFEMANQMPNLVVLENELDYFSEFEIDVIGVEYNEKMEILEEGGFKTKSDAILQGFQEAYFHIKGRSKRDIDADSPWYPLHDTNSESEANRMLARYKALTKQHAA